jgi:hypothetical protein
MGSGNRRDPATGRKMRERAAMDKDRNGPRPERHNGKIVRGGRLAAARARNTRGR